MASAKLTKTYSSSSNRRTYTLSLWAKFASAGTNLTLANIGPFSGDNEFRLTRDSNDRLEIYDYGSSAYKMRIRTTRLFRDVNGWYHIVVAVDTTQGSASDRLKLYVNGVQETSYSAETQANSNLETAWGIAQNYTLAATESGDYMDGQIAHFHYVDGTAHTPTTFGETDATTGIWKPKVSPSVTYGTNGFFLKFDNSANMGLDSGGGGNNWTTNGTIIQTKSTPSNVFTTMNSLNSNPNITYTQVNNTVNADGGGDLRTAVSTLGATSGKYYAEAKVVSIQDAIHVGLVAADSFAALGSNNYGWAIHQFQNSLNYMSVGKIKNYNNNTVATGLPTYGANDIIGIAADLDNSKIYFHKNGTYINSGVPTSGSTGTGAYALTANTTYLFGSSTNYTNGKVSWNFGNGYFGTTAVSSAQSPDDGNGIFEYDVPAGYRALCTKSLNAEEYS
jgi:hypothetical protein